MHVLECIREVRVLKVTGMLHRACNLISFVNLVLFGHCNTGIRPPPSSEQVESGWICSVVPPVTCEVWTGAALQWICSVVPPVTCEVWTGAALQCVCSFVPPVTCEVWTGTALPLPSSPISVTEVSSNDLHSP